jgi:hypothetical protein
MKKNDMKELNFKSQICTTMEQSKRLLELGLKPETADMHHFKQSGEFSVHLGFFIDSYQYIPNWYQPAWSLHRLIELMDIYEVVLDWKFGIYECAIIMLEERIKDGLVDKKYLKQ